MHVDDFTDDYKSDPYACFVFTLFRLPAGLACRVTKWTEQYKLYCDFEGKRWRCIGASRMGDVWLTENLDSAGDGFPYQRRIDAGDCSNWGPVAGEPRKPGQLSIDDSKIAY